MVFLVHITSALSAFMRRHLFLILLLSGLQGVLASVGGWMLESPDHLAGNSLSTVFHCRVVSTAATFLEACLLVTPFHIYPFHNNPVKDDPGPDSSMIPTLVFAVCQVSFEVFMLSFRLLVVSLPTRFGQLLVQHVEVLVSVFPAFVGTPSCLSAFIWF